MKTKLVNGKRIKMTQFEIDRLARSSFATSQDIRSQRDSFLKESDWTQLPDAPVDQTAWATYRQELRDITQQEGFPENVTWPTKPE